MRTDEWLYIDVSMLITLTTTSAYPSPLRSRSFAPAVKYQGAVQAEQIVPAQARKRHQ